MKVFEFAKEVGVETIALMDKIRSWKLPVKSHMASLTEEQIDEIKQRLDEESGGAKRKTAKKVVKKKATTSKKKAVVKKTTVKKVVSEPATTPPKKVASKKKSMVIRRKAADIEALLRAQEEAAENLAEQEVLTSQAVPTLVEEGFHQSQQESKSEPFIEEPTSLVGTSAESSTTSSPVVKRRNIVGKMDLSRVTSSPSRIASQSSSPRPTVNAPASAIKPGQRTGPSRNIRTGFVGPAPMIPQVDNLDILKKVREDKKKKAGGGKDQPVQSFTAADFRKREIIFQPKKKKSIIGVSKKTEITQPKAIKRIVKMQDTITVS